MHFMHSLLMAVMVVAYIMGGILICSVCFPLAGLLCTRIWKRDDTPYLNRYNVINRFMNRNHLFFFLGMYTYILRNK
jgi:hypothetical protein